MKTQLKRVASLVFCVCLLASMLAVIVSAETTATISFADKANRTTYSTEQQVWEQNGITVTNNKGASTSNVGDYANPGRFYKSSDVTISYPGMTKIVIDATGSQDKYITPWVDSCKDSNATATIDGKVVTIVFAEAVDSFSLTTTAQARAASMTIYTSSSSAPVDPEEPEVPENNDPEADSVLSIADAIALGASKEHNTYTSNKYYVSGVITEVYNTQYGNMKITDADGNIITVYGTYSADGSTRYDAMEVKPVAGDTVTVYGIIGQYNGTAQLKNAWITEHIPSTEPEEPEVPENNDPEADSVLSIADALALGASKEHNTYTANKYYVSGVITEVYNTQYGNMKITDADGNIITVYGTYSADGSTRYDAMEVKPVAGDTVTVYGIIGQYNGTAQLKNAWITEHVPAVTDPEEPDVDDPVDTVISSVELRADVAIVEGNQTFTATLYSVNGSTDLAIEAIAEYVVIWYDGTTFAELDLNTVFEAGVVYDMYVRFNAADGYTIGDICNVTFVCPSGEFVGEEYSANCSDVKYAVDIFLTATANEGGEDDADDTLTIEEAIALGTSKEHNTYTEEKYYVTGVITSVYNTQYGNMYITDENGNTITIYGTYSADGELRYDAMELQPIAGDTVTVYGVVGQYNGNAQLKNAWITNIIVGDHEDDPVVEDPEADSTLSIEDAIALGESKTHNAYTENKYYVTGVITEVYNDMYGNMYLTDEDGNVITVYGTYSADGENRYDAMEVKPVAGDTVTVYGVIGQYNGNAQVKNAWIVSHTPAEPDLGGGDESDTSVPEPIEPGDATNVMVMVIIMAVSAAAVVFIVKGRSRA